MTTQALSAYRAHDLNIMMKTSSGDIINLDFSNEKSLQYAKKQNGNGSEEMMKFSSMQSFSFSMKTNGIDEQDKKEIAAFMKIAQPYIDKFLKEIKEDAPKSPVNKIAQQIADVFSPMKAKDEDTKAVTKNSIVKMFDDAIEQNKEITKSFNELFKQTQKLLEKTLHAFDKETKEIYV